MVVLLCCRSGSEGYYPDLLSFAERRLAVLKPKR